MRLTLADAAHRMGRSVRQVRYMIQQKTLPAEKYGGVWMVEEDDLPVDGRARRRQEVVAQKVEAAVTAALQPEVREVRRYGVGGVRVFRALVEARKAAKERLPAGHPALAGIELGALALARGIHGFQRAAKIAAFDQARDRVAEAVAWMFLEEAPGSHDLAAQLEATVLAGIGGLVEEQDVGIL